MKLTFLILASIILLRVQLDAQPMDSLFAVISYDTVTIWNTGAWENCGSLFKMEMSVSNDTIYIMETDTSTQLAFCTCYFDMSVSVTGLQSGIYYVEVNRQIPLLYPDTTFYIGSFSFIYGGSASAFSYNSYQSPCKIVGVKNKKQMQMKAELGQNFPNPFNPSTTIKYSISYRSIVTLKLYDILGKEIQALINVEKPAGDFEYRLDLQDYDLPSGVYFYQLRAGNFVQTKKMVKIK